MAFDLSGYLRALSGDWVTMISVAVSLILIVMGFFKDAGKQRPLLWGVAWICFGSASIRLWTIEHQKLGDELAGLDSNIETVYTDGAPVGFPAGRPIRLAVLWTNKGTGPARDVEGAEFKVYHVSTGASADLLAALQNFKDTYGKADSTSSDHTILFPASPPRRFVATGGILTDELLNTIFGEKRETVLVVGALRYSDGGGQHVTHLCRFLSGLDPGSTQWTDCPEYNGTADVK